MPPGIRAQRALATRRRMVAAAYELFCANGYLGTSMAAIAAEAGVAVQTLYYTFHTKAELLGEAIGAAVVGFELWVKPPPEPIEITDLLTWNAWWPDFDAAPDSRTALLVYITNGISILERMGPLVAAMHGGAGDPDAEAVVQIAEQRRIATYREIVERIACKPGGLRDGITEAEATDILVVLFSAEVFHSMARGRGWSRDHCARFFVETLTSLLLGPGLADGG
ncbi:TetR/AcrR family transcriptional regulator [Hoyosella subflava]|uniref:Transcriptional regulator, TetR family n=1 Tax=Hoyosella subflava (strain DSM 45089 / JCM 17490 / NBRC 109087 / DQS3-9A1) TaxID=443218 RepID=F6EQD0_HOYSD|nr:TetR/AcrR family transcriptional regulator [Hoyosella subflava]AEF40615.1 Transcriptional regulator, TetR family [Hoyosella subflava DQS3-9A1]